MNDNNEKLIAKIRALLSKTVENGATEAEAQAAMKMASQLIARYSLNAEQVQSTSESYVERKISFTSSYGNRLWVNILLNVIGKYNAVYVLLFGKEYILFGTEQNITITLEFFEYAYNCAINSGKSKFKTQSLGRYKFWSSYGYGFALGVSDMLNNVANESDVQGLILNRLAQVKQSYSKKVVTKPQRKTKLYYNTISSGRKDGTKLRKAVNSRSEVKQLTSK